MSKTVTIPEEIYERLEIEAKARGLTISQTIGELAQERELIQVRSLVQRLSVKGLLVSSNADQEPSASEFTPIPILGKPISETIIEERR